MREREVDGDNIPSPKTTSISSRGTPLVSGYTEVQGKLLMTAYKSEKRRTYGNILLQENLPSGSR